MEVTDPREKVDFFGDTGPGSDMLATKRPFVMIVDDWLERPLEDWGRECRELRLMYSPDGVFGHYVPSEWHVTDESEGLEWQYVGLNCGEEIRYPSGDDRPRHVMLPSLYSFETAMQQVLDSAADRLFTFRSGAVPTVYARGELRELDALLTQSQGLRALRAAGFRIVSGSFYLSQKGSVTNLHVDDDGGFVRSATSAQDFCPLFPGPKATVSTSIAKTHCDVGRYCS
jgi:hypothetical protein